MSNLNQNSGDQHVDRNVDSKDQDTEDSDGESIQKCNRNEIVYTSPTS